jgi:lysozyme family protein
MRYADIWPRYAGFWDKMVIRPDRLGEFTKDAEAAIAHKVVYQQLETATGVPWSMLAVIHRRESDANFSTYLGNGQALIRITTIVPRGRGPFTGPNAFIAGGIDAIKQEGWGSITDWRIEKELYYSLLFNGVGTEPFHPSSYIWGGTNIQVPGKWVRDHVFDPRVWDPQPGCAPLLKTIAQLDPTVTFARES